MHETRHDAGIADGKDAIGVMGQIGQREIATQKRIIKLFKDDLDYRYLGDWRDQPRTSPIELDILKTWLTERGYSEALIARALRELDRASALGDGKNLYDANKAVYSLLRYGIKVSEGAGEHNQTIYLIDWDTTEANDFAIAEEVSVKGELTKRPDLVLYVNGIALGVIELKRSSVSIGEGIRQNLDNQKKAFVRNFFTTMQLVMAGNDTQGMRTVRLKRQNAIITNGKKRSRTLTSMTWTSIFRACVIKTAF